MEAKATQKPSVDDIWKQLNAKNPRQSGKNFDKLWHGFSSDVGTKAAPSGRDAGYNPLTGLLKAKPAAGDAGGAAKQAVSDVSASATAPMTMERSVQALQATEASLRKAALLNIQAAAKDAGHVYRSEFEDLADSQIGKALLRRFDDPSEVCRELAVATMREVLLSQPDAVLGLLPYVMPVLEERLQPREGAKGPVEASEEVRLLLFKLLHQVILLAHKGISAYAAEAIEMLKAACTDGFHEVCLEACSAMQAVAEILGMRLHTASKEMVAALLPLTTHKRHKVRIAAIQTLRPVMHQGAHEMILEMVAFRSPNVVQIKAFYGDDLKVNFCGKMATDPHPQVRLEFLHMLGDWMLHLRERVDHEHRLLPYVLSALSDDNPQIQAAALALIDQLGAAYEKEHEKELKDTIAYLPEEAHALGWQEARCEPCVYGAADPAAAAPSAAGGAALPPLLRMPPPFETRPRLGSRILVQANFGMTLHALCNELAAWQAEPKARGATLLRTSLVFAEDTVTKNLQVLLPALCRAAADPDIASVVHDCCAILGCFVGPERVLEIIAPRVADEEADVATRSLPLRALAHYIRGAGPRGVLGPFAPRILELLETDAFLRSEDAGVRSASLAVVTNLIAAAPVAACEVAPRLLLALAHLAAAAAREAASVDDALASPAGNGPAAAPGSATATGMATVGGPAAMAATGRVAGDVPAGAAAVEAATARLAAACGCASVDELIGTHRTALLARCVAGAAAGGARDVAVFCRLLAPASYAPAVLAHGSAIDPAEAAALLSHSLGRLQLHDSAQGASDAEAPAAVRGSCYALYAPAHTDALLLSALPAVGAAAVLHSKAGPQLLACAEVLLSALPAGSFSAAGLNRLFTAVVPALLSGTHPLALLAALRLLRLAAARRLAPPPALSAGLAANATALCCCLTAGSLATRLEACDALHAFSDALSPGCLCAAASAAASAAADATGAAEPSGAAAAAAAAAGPLADAPRLVASLAERLDDASEKVALKAAALLVRLVRHLQAAAGASSSAAAGSGAGGARAAPSDAAAGGAEAGAAAQLEARLVERLQRSKEGRSPEYCDVIEGISFELL